MFFAFILELTHVYLYLVDRVRVEHILFDSNAISQIWYVVLKCKFLKLSKANYVFKQRGFFDEILVSGLLHKVIIVTLSHAT